MKQRPARDIQIFPGYFLLNGVKCRRPVGVDDENLERICEVEYRCPHCSQRAGVQARMGVSGSMLNGLIHLYMAHRRAQNFNEYIFINAIISGIGKNYSGNVRGDLSKFKHWGMLEKSAEDRYDGMPGGRAERSGLYRLTPEGRRFVNCTVKIPQYAIVYNRECLALYGAELYISQFTVKGFDWEEAFHGAPEAGDAGPDDQLGIDL